jgi:hypothetical protein
MSNDPNAYALRPLDERVAELEVGGTVRAVFKERDLGTDWSLLRDRWRADRRERRSDGSRTWRPTPVGRRGEERACKSGTQGSVRPHLFR